MRATEEQLREFIARGQATTEALAAFGIPAPGAPRARRNRPEDALQRSVCAFWSLAYPDTWEKTFHTPNGLAAKNPKLAGIFKGLGVKPGVFDLLCIARRGPFNGFALELKDTRGRASENQTAWAARYYAEGWSVTIAYSLDTALEAVRAYHRHAPRSPC